MLFMNHLGLEEENESAILIIFILFISAAMQHHFENGESIFNNPI